MIERILMHAVDCPARGVDVRGWVAAEKYDGARAYWDGEHLYSRTGKLCPAPEEWVAGLPAIPLDCELMAFGAHTRLAGRQQAAHGIRTGEMAGLELVIFDAPGQSGGVIARLAAVGLGRGSYQIAEYWHLSDEGQLARNLATIRRRGGEGLMIRPPESPYVAGRRNWYIKIKRWAER